MSPEHANISGLMDRASSGDSGAFAELALASQDQLLRFALAQGLTWADAADAVQETFLRAYRGRRRWQAGGRVMPWLYGIAMNVVREHRRKWRGRSVGVAEEILAASHQADGPRGLGRDEAQLRRLALALESLPPQQREAVACRYLRRMSVGDTAATMGCAEGTVKAAVATALASPFAKLQPGDQAGTRHQ